MDIQKTSETLSPHRVTIKDGNLTWQRQPYEAIRYLVAKLPDTKIIIHKQRMRSITITIYCTDDLYELIKLHFVKDMGRDFLWRD